MDAVCPQELPITSRLRSLPNDEADRSCACSFLLCSPGEIRGKTTTLDGPVKSLKDLKEWNFDGSSTNQGPGGNSDVYLRPAAYYPDPFRRGDNVIVLAECYNNDGTPNKSNYRYQCTRS